MQLFRHSRMDLAKTLIDNKGSYARTCIFVASYMLFFSIMAFISIFLAFEVYNKLCGFSISPNGLIQELLSLDLLRSFCLLVFAIMSIVLGILSFFGFANLILPSLLLLKGIFLKQDLKPEMLAAAEEERLQRAATIEKRKGREAWNSFTKWQKGRNLPIKLHCDESLSDPSRGYIANSLSIVFSNIAVFAFLIGVMYFCISQIVISGFDLFPVLWGFFPMLGVISIVPRIIRRYRIAYVSRYLSLEVGEEPLYITNPQQIILSISGPYKDRLYRFYAECFEVSFPARYGRKVEFDLFTGNCALFRNQPSAPLQPMLMCQDTGKYDRRLFLEFPVLPEDIRTQTQIGFFQYEIMLTKEIPISYWDKCGYSRWKFIVELKPNHCSMIDRLLFSREATIQATFPFRIKDY